MSITTTLDPPTISINSPGAALTVYFQLASSPPDSDPIRVEVLPDIPDVGDLVRIGNVTHQVDSRRWDVDKRRVYVRLDVLP